MPADPSCRFCRSCQGHTFRGNRSGSKGFCSQYPDPVEQEKIPLAREFRVGGPVDFFATLTPTDATPGPTRSSVPTSASSGFLGKAVGTIRESIRFWEETFEKDVYVSGILTNGYKIPVRMTPEQRATIYREKNNKSARTEMDFVCTEVARLLAAGQVVELIKAPKVTHTLSAWRPRSIPTAASRRG
jgi:hypothetical protein